MERRRVRALSAHTEFVSGYGMIPFDPDSGREELRFPLIPVDAIPSLVGKGWVADDVEVEAVAEAAVEAETEAPPVAAPAATGKPKGGRPAKAKADEVPADAGPAADEQAPPA